MSVGSQRKTAPGRFAALRRRFSRDDGGSVAIEFSMLAIPFALILFAIIESCVSFAAQQQLSHAAEYVARQVRTGELRGIGRTELRKIVCDRIQTFVGSGCPGLEVDLRSYPSYAAAAAEKVTVTGGRLDTSRFDVKPGPPQSINMLRVFYRWPVLIDLLKPSLATLEDGKVLQFAAVTFKNEPFERAR